MKVYINSATAISPQQTFCQPFELVKPERYETEYLKCLEPDYKAYVNPTMIRRMGRVVKMGVAAAIQCLKDAGLENPDAIITGTGLGCIEDTETFLNDIIKNNEQFLPPTSFIQSTHNTIAGQIALLLKCNSYNYAYVHRNFSFENALQDALMMMSEQHDQKILIGGVDEITPTSFKIMKRLDLYKSVLSLNTDIFKERTDGSIAGEGAAFFVLSENRVNAFALVDGVKIFYKPETQTQTEQQISSFINERGLSLNDIDAVIMGYSADRKSDNLYDTLADGLFASNNLLFYKHLCGEYFASSSFAMWAATNILKQNSCPDCIKLRGGEVEKYNHILIYNQFENSEHALILLSSC